MVIVVPLSAMECLIPCWIIQKDEFKPTKEWLIYPKNARIEIKVLPHGVDRVDRSNHVFRVPIGMDSTLIHPTLIPDRIPDMQGNRST